MSSLSQSFSPGFWGRLVAGSPRWTIAISKSPSIIYDGRRTPVALDTLASASIVEGKIWCDIRVGDSWYAGLTNTAAQQLIAVATQVQDNVRLIAAKAEREAAERAEIERLKAKFAELSKPLLTIKSALDTHLNEPIYIRKALREKFLSTCYGDLVELRNLQSLLSNPFFLNDTYAETKSQLNTIFYYCNPPYTGYEERNKKFTREEAGRQAEFFKRIEKSPLTPEQQLAVVVHEDRNRLVAAAGSGKSSTLVAKVGYALNKGYVTKSEEVLALAFNNDAANELAERLLDRLKRPIQAQTFHSLGRSILQSSNGRKSVLRNAGIALKNQLTALLANDPLYRANFYLFYAVHQQTEPEREFKSVDEYEAFIRRVGRRDKDKDVWGIPSLRGENVRSFEELTIANWLYVNGVNYCYEPSYPYDLSEEGWNKYEPDFSYTLPDGTTLFHEHFALRDDGTSPFGKSYVKGVSQKRLLHQKHKTKLIETSSADFRRGDVLTKLAAQLKAHQITLQPMTGEQIDAALTVKPHDDFVRLVSTLIAHAKESGVDDDVIRRRAKGIQNQVRTQSFLSLLFPLWACYEKYLTKTNQIDFADMISKATALVQAGTYESPYKLILVDEFQDISRGRANLVQALLAQHADSVLFGVGDDWQAINRFAGSDLSIMKNFESEFGKTESNYLRKTFRSNQGICDVAKTFISENKKQIEKDVIAVSPKTEGVIRIVEFFDIDEQLFKIQSKLDSLSEKAKIENRMISVMLIGRYKYKTTKAIADEQIEQWNKTYVGSLEIKQKEVKKNGELIRESLDSVHSSKGLEADFVLVHSLQAKHFGFPSEMEDDVLLTLVLAERDTFPYAEDRRLFYVALTRAKEEVTLYVSKEKPSSFVLELLNKKKYGTAVVFEDSEESPTPCPRCGQGYMIIKDGVNGLFIGCSAFRNNQCREKRSLTAAEKIATAKKPFN